MRKGGAAASPSFACSAYAAIRLGNSSVFMQPASRLSNALCASFTANTVGKNAVGATRAEDSRSGADTVCR